MAFTRLSRLAVTLALLCITAVAVPAQWPGSLALQVRPYGSYLGLKLGEVDEDRAKALKLTELGGVEISAVEEGAAGDQAGIRPGDVVLSYNGEKVLGVHQLGRLVAETPPGRHVRVVCWRGGVQKEIVVVTGAVRTIVVADEDLPRMRVTDIPATVMLWRNLVLGLESEALSDQLLQSFGVKQGILVWNVLPSYPAQRAGLRAGDVVTGLCGHPVNSPRELGNILQQMQSSRKAIAVEVLRDHKAISLPLSFDGER